MILDRWGYVYRPPRIVYPPRVRIARGIVLKDNPVMDQTQFRFRNDDGDEAAATWRQAVNVDDTQPVDTVLRVRFTVAETAGKAKTNFKPQLEYQLNGGGFLSVTATSSVVQSAASQLVDGNDCTQQISTTTFVTTNEGQDEVDGRAGGTNCDYVGNDKAEFEYSYQIISGDVVDSDVIDLRIAGLDNYTVADATITVSEAAPAGSLIFGAHPLSALIGR